VTRLGENSYLSHKLLLLEESAFVLALIVFVSTATFAAGAQTGRATRVLMLFSESKFVPGNALIEKAATQALLESYPGGIEFYAEYLDAIRFPSESYYQLFRDYLREKYAQRSPDLVMAFLARKFELAGELPAQLFPGVPVVLAALTEEEIPRERLGVNVTGVIQRLDLPGTLSFILKLQPDTQRIVVIGGTAPLDQVHLGRAEAAARAFAGRVEFDFWTQRSVPEMQKDVAILPPRTVILFTSVFRDAAGVIFFPEQVLSLLAPVASVPVYGIVDSLIGKGAVGGAVAGLEATGKRAGELAQRVLSGADPASLPFESRTNGIPMVDWGTLQRWRISESALPPGTVVRFKPPSIWEQYHWYIVGALIILGLQAVMIAGLLLQRARRRRVEQEARALSGRLLTAQEDERRRLARDLHDDLTQRLACLAIDAGKIERSDPGSDNGELGRSMRKELVRLSEDVHALSYRLHPSLLDELGLVEALNAECDGFSRRESIPVEFKPRDVPREVPPQTALCLFRVAQESLRNVARHARASAVEVSLRCVDGGLEMAVSDNGAGFDPGNGRAQRSLGLASMKERIDLLGGELDIESAPGHGTAILAWVGLKKDEKV
jgi:signal transduction histidine kinase